MYSLDCFKAYDIRGIVPEQLNVALAYDIGRAYATVLPVQKVVIGNDIRLTGPALTLALAKGLQDSGVDVVNIGQCGTEEVYFAVPFLQADGGICVTASHNPANYNGMKMVGKNSVPISGDTGLNAIRQCIADKSFAHKPKAIGRLSYQDTRAQYAQKLLSFVSVDHLAPLKIVVNPGNGGAGAVIDAVEKFLPFEFIKINYRADGHFPNGVPNPLLPECRLSTTQAVQKHNADFGVAWDGDFDRCFFFDEKGEFVEGYYLVSLLANVLLKNSPRERVVYDPRLYWNTQAMLNAYGAQGIMSKTGHAFIKQTMRKQNAVYGGEMSAHHYFRDFYYCDNGNIPWLLIASLLSTQKKPLSELVKQSLEEYPCSGEINLKVKNADRVMSQLLKKYQTTATSIDDIDGLGMNFSEWRFNVRSSNTEPLLRVNVESRGNKTLLDSNTRSLIDFIRNVND